MPTRACFWAVASHRRPSFLSLSLSLPSLPGSPRMEPQPPLPSSSTVVLRAPSRRPGAGETSGKHASTPDPELTATLPAIPCPCMQHWRVSASPSPPLLLLLLVVVAVAVVVVVVVVVVNDSPTHTHTYSSQSQTDRLRARVAMHAWIVVQDKNSQPVDRDTGTVMLNNRPRRSWPPPSQTRHPRPLPPRPQAQTPTWARWDDRFTTLLLSPLLWTIS